MRHAVLVLTLTLLMAGCAGEDSIEPVPPKMFHLLPPAASLGGWQVADGPMEYSPATLYEYLNGGAERYETLGFRGLIHIRYQRGADPLASVILDVYDMGTALGAFGIYSAGRPQGCEALQWGAEGYRSGTIAAAYKESVFIHGEADDDRQELLAFLDDLVSGVAGGVPGSTSPPAILDSLPKTHLVVGSERYVPTDLIGHSYLPGGVLATYEIDGRRAELFFTDLDTEARAMDATTALRSHFEGRDAIAKGDPPMGDGGFRTNDRVFGQGTVVRSGALITGIHGDLTTEEREDLLGLLISGH